MNQIREWFFPQGVLARVVRWYLAIGVVCALGYLFQGGTESAWMLTHLPVGWVVTLSWVVAWPLMLPWMIFIRTLGF
jgi:hypothetical protein